MTDIQAAARPIGICRQKKSLRRPLERESLRPFGIIRIVGFKFQAAPGFHHVEQNDGVIDGQRREFHQMDNGQMILFERSSQ